MTWDGLADWWLEETANDPSYGADVIPLVRELMPQEGFFLDAGCGDGHVSHVLTTKERTFVGCDINRKLAERAGLHQSVVLAELPDLRWLRAGSLDGVLLTLVIEHLEDLGSLFRSAWTATKPEGVLVLVANHPIVTAPESANVVDTDDGEVFWRPGSYLDQGVTHERAGDRTVVFHHRPISVLLNAAADEGWVLQRTVERLLPSDLPDAGFPRLVGLRWTKP